MSGDIVDSGLYNTEEHLTQLLTALVRVDDSELKARIESHVSELCQAAEEAALDVILYQQMAVV